VVENIYENIGCDYLSHSGFDILARNYRIRGGEIDIIVKRGRDIYFVEVRHRSKGSFETALESVTRDKMKKIVKTAIHFINNHLRRKDYNYHFSVMDVGETEVREILWDAFCLEDVGYYFWP